MNSKKEWLANRDSDGIVYCFADGTTQVIRLEDYLLENPEYTADDFNKIKLLSDELFYMQNRSDDQYSQKKSPADFDTVTAMIPASEPEPCIAVLRREQRKIAIRAALFLLRSGKLSLRQRRRFVAYFLHGKSVSEIARTEAVNRSSVWRGLHKITAQLQSAELN
ncbi:RNA polymerase sigma factor [Agathobaculum sp. Marseille-P7918]|uniref:RNA polymerase sigma factor n=1 Tax=Agathobaculum sp. Marseille-P7918 TaxID=2479843 RepID=UPI003567EF7E